MLDDQFLHDTAHRFRVDMAIDMDHLAFARICLRFARVSLLSAPRDIEDGQHFETATADRLIVDKIPGPNMAGMFALRGQPGGDAPTPTS